MKTQKNKNSKKTKNTFKISICVEWLKNIEGIDSKRKKKVDDIVTLNYIISCQLFLLTKQWFTNVLTS